MKLFIILISVILTGCATPRFSPGGQIGISIPYYTTYEKKYKCDWCHKKTSMYKVDNKGRVICKECFEKHYK